MGTVAKPAAAVSDSCKALHAAACERRGERWLSSILTTRLLMDFRDGYPAGVDTFVAGLNELDWRKEMDLLGLSLTDAKIGVLAEEFQRTRWPSDARELEEEVDRLFGHLRATACRDVTVKGGDIAWQYAFTFLTHRRGEQLVRSTEQWPTLTRKHLAVLWRVCRARAANPARQPKTLREWLDLVTSPPKPTDDVRELLRNRVDDYWRRE